MAKRKIKPEEIFQVMAHGHVFPKHVLGVRNDKRVELEGINEFRHSGHGLDLKIESPGDLSNYLKESLTQGKWEGFSHPRTQKFYFYNKTDNVVLIVNTKLSKDEITNLRRGSDLGSVYRPKSVQGISNSERWEAFKTEKEMELGGKIKEFKSSEKGIGGLAHEIVKPGKLPKTQYLLDLMTNAVNTSDSARNEFDKKYELIENKDSQAINALKEKENTNKALRDVNWDIDKLEKEKAKAGEPEKQKLIPDDSQKSTKAADLIDEAAGKADEAAKAVKAARAAKLGKLALVSTVGLTVVAAGFIDKAYASQRESAELFLKGGALKPDAFNKYIGLNKKVENLMQAENIAGQGWAFLVTTPIVEAKAALMFSKFSQKHNLSPKVHQALGMSMLDGKSTIGKFADAAFDAIPNKKKNATMRLHSLIDSKNRVTEAKSQYLKAEVDNGIIKTVKALDVITLRPLWAPGKMSAQTSLSDAKKNVISANTNYTTELQKTFSDPVAAKFLINKIPKAVLLDMTVATARSNQNNPNTNPLIRQLGEFQNKLASLDGKKGSEVEKQREHYNKRTNLVEKLLSDKPEVLKQHIINQMANKKTKKTLETNTNENPKSHEGKNEVKEKKVNINSADDTKLYSSLSSTEKKQYLPAQAWKQLGFLPKDGEKGERFAMKNARGEEKHLQMHSAKSVYAEDTNDKRDPAQVSQQYQKQVALVRSSNQSQGSEMEA